MTRAQPGRFEDYWPVDVEKLRQNESYGRMIEIRRDRIRTYLGPDGMVEPSRVEPRACPVCDKSDAEPKFEKEGFTFVACRPCGTVYVDPCLKASEIQQVYQHQSYSDIMRGLMEPSHEYRRERFGNERLGIINRFVPARDEERRLLDVGSATGFFLEAARDDGWIVEGVESNPYQADFARRRGLDVRNETIEETTLAPASFDAVTLFEVIEHVRDPVAILTKVAQLLRPGGMAFVYTPNFNCAERSFMSTEAHFIWGSNHLTYFTVDTLEKAFSRAGLKVEHWETQGLDVEDTIWYFQHTGQYDVRFLQEFRHRLQFMFNESGWGKNLRMYARK